MRAVEAVREMFQSVDSEAGESSRDERASELLMHTGRHFQTSEVETNSWLASHPEDSALYFRDSPTEKQASARTPHLVAIYRCCRQPRSCLLRPERVAPSAAPLRS